MNINKVLYIFVDRTLHVESLSNYNDKNFSLFLENTEANVKSHNERLNNSHPDSGFDLLCPTGLFLNAGTFSNKVKLGIRAAMYEVDKDGNKKQPLGFYLYPRSSTGSKTTLRLSNQVGIIDSGYRGELMGVFDAGFDEVIIGSESRLLQICSGDLSPFRVKVVYNANDLEVTERGDGGFGSTGQGVRE